MSQHDMNLANQSRTAFRQDANNALVALVSLSSGATEPATMFAYQLWADTTAGVLKRRNAANTGWLVERTLNETFVLSRSSDTVLGVSDKGKMIVASGTFTQTFAAAATLGDGWFVNYRNDGTGVITMDPNASETIDGTTTNKWYPGESSLIYCNGSALKTGGRRTTAIKSGTFSRAMDAATGSVAYTGVGFKPRALLFLAVVNGTPAASWGMADASAQGGITDQYGVVAGAIGDASAALVMVLNEASGKDQRAALSSMDDDGFTLAWTRTGVTASATAVIYYLAIR